MPSIRQASAEVKSYSGFAQSQFRLKKIHLQLQEEQLSVINHEKSIRMGLSHQSSRIGRARKTSQIMTRESNDAVASRAPSGEKSHLETVWWCPSKRLIRVYISIFQSST